MCNPPFYTSREEMAQSSESKSQQPSSVCTGADVEMVTKGGEVAFVTKMIDESLNLRDRIQWYTSMLGKLSSVSVLVEALIKHGNHNYAVTEFVQGSKTKRWALAWSWGDRRPSMVWHPLLLYWLLHGFSLLTICRVWLGGYLDSLNIYYLSLLTTTSRSRAKSPLIMRQNR